MQSRQRRAGAPVLHACGPRLDGGGLQVGLLAVSAQLDDLIYDLHEVTTDGERTGEPIRVRLPPALQDLPEDRWVERVALPLAEETP